MRMIGLVRFGADAVLRFTPAGDPVLEVPAAYNYGSKGEDGRRPTQWIRLTMWGQRAEKLEQYFTKGTQILAVVEEVHIETYDKKDGSRGFNLVGRLADFEFAGGTGERESSQQQAAPAAQHRPATQEQEFFEDDIPF